MARELINGISVPIAGTGEPADFIGDLRSFATDLSASFETAVPVTRFGALGDGVTDDTAAIQACIDWCGANNRAVFLPGGQYVTGELTDSYGVDFLGSGLAVTRLWAKPGTTVMLTSQDSSNKRISGILFDGRGYAETCLDTSWTQGDGPSVGNVYRDLWLQNYTTLGWIAEDNNDCPFENVSFIAQGGDRSIPAIQLTGAGGAVWMKDCRIFGPLLLSAQIAYLNGCVTHDIQLQAGAWNMLDIDGGYWFAGVDTGCNLYLAASAATYAATISSHMENAETNGSLIGGTGRVEGYISVHGGSYMPVQGATGVRLIGPDLTLGAPQGVLTLDGTWLDGAINDAGTSAVRVIKRAVKVDDQIESQEDDLAFDSGWIAVSAFTNSWTNYGFGLPDAAYRKIGRTVYLRGHIKDGSALETAAFTLPTGFRPSANEGIAVSSANAFGRISVNTDGTVVPAVGNTGEFSLGGVSFTVA